MNILWANPLILQKEKLKPREDKGLVSVNKNKNFGKF
jgi:hypothetical protein